MKLELKRQPSTDKATIGELSIDGKPYCYTLEDVVREVEGQPVKEWKIPHETAIPCGTYHVILTYSNRFKKYLPLLLDVPGFSGVRIHPGNGPDDTEGCILVGKLDKNRPDWVSQSRIVFGPLMQRLDDAYERGDPITLEIA